MRAQAILLTCCIIAAVSGTGYALAVRHDGHSPAASPVQAAPGPWRKLGAANPGDTGASTHFLRRLRDLPLIDGSLGLLTLEQTAASDGSVGRIYGAGVVKAPATRARLQLLDGSVASLPLVDLAGGFRGFAFVAAEPELFPTAIQGLDAAGTVVAQFRFDPNQHP